MRKACAKQIRFAQIFAAKKMVFLWKYLHSGYLFSICAKHSYLQFTIYAKHCAKHCAKLCAKHRAKQPV